MYRDVSDRHPDLHRQLSLTDDELAAWLLLVHLERTLELAADYRGASQPAEHLAQEELPF